MIGRPFYIGARGRAHSQAVAARHGAAATTASAVATPFTLPLDAAGVHRVASAGFPLWESIPVMQLRNERITLAYGDLSHQLAARLAGTDDRDRWDANWCSFATWSSKTIGTCIDLHPEEGTLHQALQPLPEPVRRIVYRLAEVALCRGHGAMYRTLAIGNRIVFLELATAVTRFLDAFPPGARPDDRAFAEYWTGMGVLTEELAQLDPSWVDTGEPDMRLLRQGMQAYASAMAETEPSRKAQYVLAGNLLLGAYEQRRVQGYLLAALALFSDAWLQRIVRGCQPTLAGLARNRVDRVAAVVYSTVMTRLFLVLEVPHPPPGNLLKVGRPVPPVPPAEQLRWPEALQTITVPVLQALLSRFDLSGGEPQRSKARDWADFDQRMSYITTIFRSRQRDRQLFSAPWTDEEKAHLLAGRGPVTP